MAAGVESGAGPLVMARFPPGTLPATRHLPRPQALPPAQRMLERLTRRLGKETSPCRPRPGLGSRRPRPTGSCSVGQPLPGSTASLPGGESRRRKRAQRGVGTSPGSRGGSGVGGGYESSYVSWRLLGPFTQAPLLGESAGEAPAQPPQFPLSRLSYPPLFKASLLLVSVCVPRAHPALCSLFPPLQFLSLLLLYLCLPPLFRL